MGRAGPCIEPQPLQTAKARTKGPGLVGGRGCGERWMGKGKGEGGRRDTGYWRRGRRARRPLQLDNIRIICANAAIARAKSVSNSDDSENGRAEACS